MIRANRFCPDPIDWLDADLVSASTDGHRIDRGAAVYRDTVRALPAKINLPQMWIKLLRILQEGAMAQSLGQRGKLPP